MAARGAGATDGGPAVTVVVPVWDAYVGAGLAAALESIRTQDHPSRIVIVDNASRTAVSSGPADEVVRTPIRLSVGAARNLGLSRVTTDYVVVWDADDVMAPGALGSLVHAISAGGEDVLAVGSAIVDAGSGRRHRWPRRWQTRLIHRRPLFALLNSIWGMFPTVGATIMRTAAVRATGGYTDAESGDDWGLSVAIAFRGRLGWIERSGRIYTDTQGSIWTRHGGTHQQIRHARAVRDRLREDARTPGWARRMLPLIAAGQWAAIFLGHVPRELARGASRWAQRRHSRSTDAQPNHAPR